MSDKSGASPDALPVPKGGGATRGLGDSFTPDFNRGTGSYSIEIDLPAGHRGLKPTVGLNYNSGAGDGPFGFGWDVSLPHIQVDTDLGVADYLRPAYLFGGETLVDMGAGRFRPRVENPFNRIRRDGEHWEVTDKSGIVTLYGSTPAGRVTGLVGGVERVFAWMPEVTRDTTGNEIRFGYLRDGNNLYIEQIDYAVFRVRFSYAARPDPSISRRAGFAIERRLRCVAIEVLRPADNQPTIRRYTLAYADGPQAPSLLARVQLEGFKRQPDGTVMRTSGPPLSLSYTPFRPERRSYQLLGADAPDFPGPLGEEGRELVDLSADGLPDVVQLSGGRPRIWRNLGGGRFAPAATLRAFPDEYRLADAQTALFDADGQGTADLVVLRESSAYYYPNLGDGSLDRPRYMGGRSPLAFDLNDPNTRFADLDGDGRVDLFQTTARGLVLWHNRGGEAGFDQPQVVARGQRPPGSPALPEREFFPDVMLSDPGVFVADMTGDGLPDIVHVQSGLVEYWPSLGDGRYDRRVVMQSPPLLPRHFEHRRLFLADIDGSGASDVVYVGADRVIVWRNIGGARFAPPIEVAGVPASSVDTIRLVDLLGQGTVGVLWSGVETAHRPGYRFLSFADTKPYLLTRIDNGVGLETVITYGVSSSHASRDRRAGEAWATRLPMPVQVIDRVTQRDLVTNTRFATDIAYHEGRWDPDARRFRGFGRVTARRSGGPGTAPMIEEHRYLVGAPGEPALGPGDARALDRARRGQVYHSIYAGANLRAPLRVEQSVWQATAIENAPDGTAILFPHVASTEVQNREGGNRPRVMTAHYRFDAFGNVVEERRVGAAPNGDDDGALVPSLEAVTRMEYAVNLQKHIVERVARTLRLDAGGALLAEVRHYYDGTPLVGLPLGQVQNGVLARQEEVVLSQAEAAATHAPVAVDWPALGYHQVTRADGAAAWAVNRTRLEHNARGMPVASVNPLGARTEFGYDADGLLVVQTKNQLGHIARASYDSSWQLIEQRTGADGLVTSYRYDGLGRVTSVVRPGDSEAFPSVRYLRADQALPTSLRTQERRTAGSGEVYEKVVYYDGFGHIVQERALVDSGQARVSGPVTYTAKGEPATKGVMTLRTGLDYEPPSALPAGPQFRYEYDALGRLVAATNLDGRQMRVAYTPWRALHHDVIDTDAAHPHAATPRVEHFDAFGRLVGVTQHSAPGVGHRASYRYDLLGRLVATTDLAGRPALSAAVYDGRGARLRFTHAACGTRTVVYDAAGHVVRYWDNRNIVVERTFDPLGRQLTESVGGVVQERYFWDQQPDQIGRLGRVDDNGGSVTFRYNARGRVAEKIRTIGGKSYQLQYEYDAAGLQSRQVYPDSTSVAFARWGDGRIRSLGGFINEASYDAQGRLVGLAHANGAAESYSYDVSGYLSEMTLARGGNALRRARLSHDAGGHLTHLEELAGPRQWVEDYDYDALERLVSFSNNRSGTTSSSSYAYDADGNMLRADELDAASFDYDFAQPGALRKRTRRDGSQESFAFDAAGHMSEHGNMRLTFDARGRLTRATKPDGTVVEMTYDYRGARVAKKVTGSPDGNYEVRYVDDLYEERAGIATAYVYLSGRLVGQRRGGGSRHLHTDHRGSVVLATRPDGSEDRRAWFGPYGAGEPMPQSECSRQFTSCVLDGETGLYYFNHRYYSPSIGRFISPDPRYLAQPERELDYPQAHNLYVYAKADPVNYIDPTGQGFWSTFGKILAGIVLVVAVIVAVAVAVAVLAAAFASGGWMIVLGATALGALIGGIEGGWEGAATGAMIGFTAGVNFAVGGPILGAITFMGVFKDIRQQGWYKSLAGWSSWFMPASWPGHIMGLGVFLANGIAHVFGSDKQIESVKFDWKHGQILTAGGEYGGSPFPWLGIGSAPAHNVGGFSFFTNELWSSSGSSWEGMEETVQHETGHMLSNAIFGFWQGVINGIENFTTSDHNDRFFEQIAESNVEEAERDDYGREVPIWG